MGERKIEFPPHLRAHVDSLVSNARAGVQAPPGPALDLVTSWCEVHADESNVQSGESGGAFVVVPRDALPPGCTDDEIDLRDGSSPGINDAMRVDHARERLLEIFEGTTDDAEEYPMACFLRIRGSNGKSAALGYFWSGGGYGEDPEIEWVGVYATVTKWKADLRHRGYLIGAGDVEGLSDSHLLKLWKGSNPA